MARPKIPMAPPANQRGAVLYVALMMLILLALIGLVGMRVASLQERMSANYRAVNLAFQEAELWARNAECAIEDVVNRTTTAGCNAVNAGTIEQVCDDGFDPGAWAAQRSLTAGRAVNARLIGPCIAGISNVAMGGVVNEDPNPIYEVTAYNVDNTANPTSATVIDTIFRP